MDNWIENKVHPHVYRGGINRDYIGKTKFIFQEPGQKSYVKHSKFTLEELQKQYPKFLIRKV